MVCTPRGPAAECRQPHQAGINTPTVQMRKPKPRAVTWPPKVPYHQWGIQSGLSTHVHTQMELPAGTPITCREKDEWRGPGTRAPAAHTATHLHLGHHPEVPETPHWGPCMGVVSVLDPPTQWTRDAPGNEVSSRGWLWLHPKSRDWPSAVVNGHYRIPAKNWATPCATSFCLLPWPGTTAAGIQRRRLRLWLAWQHWALSSLIPRQPA